MVHGYDLMGMTVPQIPQVLITPSVTFVQRSYLNNKAHNKISAFLASFPTPIPTNHQQSHLPIKD